MCCGTNLENKKPSLPLDGWIAVTRDDLRGDPRLSEITALNGKPVQFLDPKKLRFQNLSSSKVREIEKKIKPLLPADEALTLEPVNQELTRSGDLVYLVTDAHGTLKLVVKAFLGEGADQRFRSEQDARDVLGALPLKNLVTQPLAFATSDDGISLVGIRPAQGQSLLHFISAVGEAKTPALRAQAIENLRKANRLLAAALRELHEHSLTHGDAAPGNFFVDIDQGKVEMIDLAILTEPGKAAYEYHQYLSGIRWVADRFHVTISPDELKKLDDEFAEIYPPKFPADENQFFEQYWKAKSAKKEILKEKTDEPWLPLPNRVTMVHGNRLPTDAPITAAYVLPFSSPDTILLGHHAERGWDIPGGHADPGETPEKTAARETFEETGATLKNFRLVGYQQIDLLGEKPAGYPYPFPKSYQVFYVADVDDIGKFAPDEDMTERKLFHLDDARKNVPWMKENPELFERMLPPR